MDSLHLHLPVETEAAPPNKLSRSIIVTLGAPEI